MAASLTAMLALCAFSACSSDGDQTTASTASESVSTTGPTTTTTLPSILPSDGTIPLPELGDVVRGDDLVATAERALRAWSDVPAECLPSEAEALAARDQFLRVATYLGKVRGVARDLQNAAAFKQLINIEASYRAYATTRTFIVCGESNTIAPSSPATTTTIVGGTAKGLAAGGIVEVDLTITGTPRVDQGFTIADVGAPCDGIGANTTFLVNSQDSSGRWVITDVIVNEEGGTSTEVVPTRAGAAAIEYLAYCGTLDKRHGVTTFRVGTTGDTTTTLPAPTTTDPSAPLEVVDLPAGNSSILVDPRTNEVAVEPESVTEFLAANGAEGGVVIARLNVGDWVALRETGVTWIPVGPGEEGLEVRIVGAKAPLERTIRVTAPTTTTTTSTTTVPAATTTVVAVVATSDDDSDTTLWVVIVLVVVAALSVSASRLRLRR